MLYREIIAVCSQIHTKHINTLCGQNVELLNVKLVVHIVTSGGLICLYKLCDITVRQTFSDKIVAMQIPCHCKLPIIANPIYIGCVMVVLY